MWSVKNSGVMLSENSIQYLDELSSLLPFDITITDGFRTARQQAYQMGETRQEQIFNGSGNLRDEYGDDELADLIQAEWHDIEKMALVIEQYADQGRYISSHLINDAWDVRTIGGPPNQLDDSQIQQLVDVANSIGINTYKERDHVHMSVDGEWVVVDDEKEKEKKSSLLWLVAIGIGVVLWTTS